MSHFVFRGYVDIFYGLSHNDIRLSPQVSKGDGMSKEAAPQEG
jgi:hypothetical protein